MKCNKILIEIEFKKIGRDSIHSNNENCIKKIEIKMLLKKLTIEIE